jgi:hypothetical protein
VTEACFRVRRAPPAAAAESTKRKRAAARRLAPAERSSHGQVVTVAVRLSGHRSTFSLSILLSRGAVKSGVSDAAAGGGRAHKNDTAPPTER